MTVLFFDISTTIADMKVAAADSMKFYSGSRFIEVLDGLVGLRKGIISYSDEGDVAHTRTAAALSEKLDSYFSDPRLVHWGTKIDRAIFNSAIESAAANAADCIFVGENAYERMIARQIGLRTAPHPVFAHAAVENRPVFWARIDVASSHTLAELETVVNSNEVVPVHVPSGLLVIAMATEFGVNALEQQGFIVELRGTIDDTSAYLIRDNRVIATPASLLAISGEDEVSSKSHIRAAPTFAYISQSLSGFAATVRSLGPGPSGVYIAAAASTPVEELHIPGTKHGHTEYLLPDPTLLSRPGETWAEQLRTEFGAVSPSDAILKMVRKSVTASVIRTHVARISGVEPLVDGQSFRVRSRDAGSDDNMLVVKALARRFEELGLAVYLHEFPFREKHLANVVAEYKVAGSNAAVLITAHLDSTAAGSEYVDVDGHPRPYDPTIDPAPGADDDASGVAAVLAAAECLSKIVDAGLKPARTLRFVLFNAEEQGLVGSKNYARAAATFGDEIAAVLQMDMIGGNQGGVQKVEIHAGTANDGAVARASNALGDVVARAAKAVAPHLEVEKITGASDPATGRSDHASFHERGWAAIAISENFFADTDPANGTRQYHLPGDTLNDRDFDPQYAADIACAVVVAAFMLVGL
ncbi:M28 family metallopeptidase [Citrobacter gillenii]|uniref:M28 family metallopeptidase n=1 Tax=Citrobacter gillenii TaxID=67828 RepID=UPI003986CEB2